MVDGFDGKFVVGKDSSFSKQFLKELGLGNDAVNKIGRQTWEAIFEIANKESGKNVNNIYADTEFSFSETGWKEILGLVDKRLKTNFAQKAQSPEFQTRKDESTKPENKKEEIKPENSPKVGPRTTDEMNKTEKKYADAGKIVDLITNYSEDTFGKFSDILKGITKENLAYLINTDQNILNVIKEKATENQLIDLATSLGVPLMSIPKGANKNALINLIKEVAKKNPANPPVTDADRNARKAEDERIAAEKKAAEAEKARLNNIANDKKALAITVPQEGAKTKNIKANENYAKQFVDELKALVDANKMRKATDKLLEVPAIVLANVLAADSSLTEILDLDLRNSERVALMKKLDPNFKGNKVSEGSLAVKANEIVEKEKAEAAQEVADLEKLGSAIPHTIKMLTEMKNTRNKDDVKVTKMDNGYEIEDKEGNLISVVVENNAIKEIFVSAPYNITFKDNKTGKHGSATEVDIGAAKQQQIYQYVTTIINTFSK